MGVREAIRRADALLPGRPSRGTDQRWQAIIEVGEFIQTNPASVWRFIRKWGFHPQKDVRTAIATVLLEHLLEYHFDAYFPKVEKLALAQRRFGETFLICWQLGQSTISARAKRFSRLRGALGETGYVVKSRGSAQKTGQEYRQQLDKMEKLVKLGKELGRVIHKLTRAVIKDAKAANRKRPKSKRHRE